METTTIQITKALKRRLEALKVYPTEPVGSVIRRLAEMAVDEEPLTKEDVKAIEQGLADIKAGKVYTTKQLEKYLGI